MFVQYLKPYDPLTFETTLVALDKYLQICSDNSNRTTQIYYEFKKSIQAVNKEF